jgi:nucleoside-diphosphate-sugar epimerase
MGKLKTGVSNKKILITGGGGFIGSYLVDKLAPNNKIAVLDNFNRNALQYLGDRVTKDIKIYKGDILDEKIVEKASAGCDIIIHCAAIAGIYSVVKSPVLTMKINFLGTYNVLEAALKNKVGTVVNFSTSEVYGPFIYKGKEDDLTSQGGAHEDRWIYSVSKLAGEHIAHSYQKEFSLGVITLRPFNIYGPRQIGEGAIQTMILGCLRDSRITLYNDGSQIRTWCFVDDFVDAVLLCLSKKSALGEIFNIGNPQGTVTNLQLAGIIARLTDTRPEFVFKKHPGPEVEMRVPDISKARRLLGFNPQVNLEEGIQRTIEWYKKIGPRKR